jgi:hypothetical protein
MSTNFEKGNNNNKKSDKNLHHENGEYEEKILEIITEFNLYTIEKVGKMIFGGKTTFIDDINGKIKNIQAFVITNDNYICPIGINEIWYI